jgi:hypothetical protein
MTAQAHEIEPGLTDTFIASVMWRVEAHLGETWGDLQQVTSRDIGKLDAPLNAALLALFERHAKKAVPRADILATLRNELTEYVGRAHHPHDGDELYARVVAHFGSALVDLSDAARELGFWSTSTTDHTADTSTLPGTYDALDSVLDTWGKAPGRVDDVVATRLHHLLGQALHLAPGDEVVATYLRDRLGGMREHLADRRDRKHSLRLFDAVLADYPALRR